MLISGKARVAGVMGWPVGHSLSPRLHGHWLQRHGIDGTYLPLPVQPCDLADAFRLLPRLGFRGWNVTLPHKEAAFTLVDRRDAHAERAGAVNTVLVEENGSLTGLNTDGIGFLASLAAAVPGWSAAAGPAVLVGCGGAARAVASALLAAGAPCLRLTNRTSERALALAGALSSHGDRVQVVPWAERAEALAEAALLVNATTQGMPGQPPLALALDRLPGTAVVTDLIYVPLETPLLAAARARGHHVVDGLGMLLHQAVPGFAHWGGVRPEVDAELRRCLLEALLPPAK